MKNKYKDIHSNLINKCKKGNSKAQFELYKLYYKAMFNTSYRIVNNTAEAEDIMQDAFLSAFDNIKSFSGKSGFGAWLKKIVVNKSLDALKKQKINIEPLDDNVKKISSQQLTKTHAESYTKNDIETIKKAMMQLPDGYRIIFSMYMLEGFDHEEISEILKISQSASRSQLTRAKQKIKKIIEKNQ
jgi:RNA polymerase sigma factor (sigma-70 family)